MLDGLEDVLRMVGDADVLVRDIIRCTFLCCVVE